MLSSAQALTLPARISTKPKSRTSPEYSAPETFKNIFPVESDYYSFGTTLFELFCGYTPYANMQAEEIEQYVSIQRVPFPKDMPESLQDLISALTYCDLSYRQNKNNPNRRRTYKEVAAWLRNEPLVIPGEGIGNSGKGSMPPFEFMGEQYTGMLELVRARRLEGTHERVSEGLAGQNQRHGFDL